VATVDRRGRTIFVADAHRRDGQRFIVHADEKLTAFLELDSATCACGESSKRQSRSSEGISKQRLANLKQRSLRGSKSRQRKSKK